MLGGEELGVDLVESCEVAGIVEEHVDADDVFKGIPGGFEHLFEVFEGDASLHGDVAGDDFAVGVAGDLSADEEPAVRSGGFGEGKGAGLGGGAVAFDGHGLLLGFRIGF